MKRPSQAGDAPSREIARLRNGLADLAGLLALSASWPGREAEDVIRTLAEALFASLSLDLVLVVVDAEPRCEFALTRRPGSFGTDRFDPAMAKAEVSSVLGGNLQAWPALAQGKLFGSDLSIATLPLGLRDGFGLITVAASRADFADDIETLILNVARNQVVNALQEQRLRHDERLQASELSASSLIEGLPGFVAVLGPDGRVERVNRQIEEYCGQPLEELRNWGTNGTVHPEDMPHVADVFVRSIASGTPYVIEQRLRRFDGEYRWFDNRGRPLRDDNGAILAWHVLLTDIDDRKRAEQAVRASESELRRQVEAFPQMLWSATPQGNIDHCNERLLVYSGLSAEMVMNGGWINLLHPDDRIPTARIWERCIATGDPYSVEVRHFNCAEGIHRWNLVTASPLRDAAGRIVKWYGACVDIHDRKLAEEALKASERYLAQIIDTIPAYVFSAGPDGAVNYLSPQLREWFGRDEDRIMAAQWVHLTHPDDREGTVAAWMGTVAAGTPYQREVRFMHCSGEYRWCDARALPLRDADGAITAWHGVVNDIHDRKLAEEALAARERHLRQAHDHLSQAQRLSQTGSFTTDVIADTHIWSDELYRILEHERSETPTFRAFRDRIHADDAARFDAAFKRSMTGQSDFDEVFRIVTSTGHTKHLHAVARFLPGEAGRPIVMGSIQDVTELKAREEELRRSAHFLAVGERVSLTGSFAWDVDSDAISMSEQLRLLLELDAGVGLCGADLRELIHPDDVEGFEERLSALARGDESIEHEMRVVPVSGRVRYIRAFVQMLRQSDRAVQRVGAVQDVTQRRVAEESLDRVRSQLAHITRITSLGELAASIAHEVNQPLAGIITNANTCLRMLTGDPPDIDGAMKTAQRSIRDGNRASEVIKRLRRLYRRQDFALEALNLNEAAQEVVAVCSHDLHRRAIALTVNLDPTLPQVLGDRIQLQQVILNLVLNAADALDEGQRRPRQIVIETGAVGPEAAQLAVRDSGRGLTAEDAERIFDAFYTTKPEGMGIGLSVSKSIIERHQGKLWACANDGPGTTFIFSIPCVGGMQAAMTTKV